MPVIVTTTNITDYMGQAAPATARITEAIDELESKLTRYLRGRQLWYASHTEVKSGNGREFLIMKHRPIIAITSIIPADGDGNFPSGDALDSSSYSSDDEAGMIFRGSKHTSGVWESTTGGAVGLSGGVWARGTSNYQVIYTAGYKAPDQAGVPAGVEDLPEEVVGALKIAVADALVRRAQVEGGQSGAELASEGVPFSQQASYRQEQDPISGWPKRSKAVFDHYLSKL